MLLLWIPLRERPGLGTVLNVLLIGLVADATLAVLDTPEAMWQRVGLLLLGVYAFGPGSGWYIGAGLGPGPRDGLMTGIAKRGHSVRAVRTGIELAVLVIGAAARRVRRHRHGPVRADRRPQRPLAPRSHEPARAAPEDERARRAPRVPRSALAERPVGPPRASLARTSWSTSSGQGRGDGHEVGGTSQPLRATSAPNHGMRPGSGQAPPVKGQPTPPTSRPCRALDLSAPTSPPWPTRHKAVQPERGER